MKRPATPEAIIPTAVYTTSETCALLGVHRNTLRKLQIRRLTYSVPHHYLGEDLLDYLRRKP